MYVTGYVGGPIHAKLPEAYHNGQLNEGAPMSMEQARAAIKAATDTSALPAVQLRALSPNTELPPASALSNDSSTVSAEELAASVLSQALLFMDGVYPAFSIQDNFVKSKGSAAPVSTRMLERGKEKWLGRNSRHVNRRGEGSADWEQFNQGLRVAHCRNQIEYKTDVEDAFKVCEWTVQNVDGWKDVTVEVFEMLHKDSFLSKPHSYPVLVVTASSTTSPQFIVAQLPVDLSSASGARYANGNNTTDITANTSSTMGKKTVGGEYISIDRVKLDRDPKNPDADPEIVWETAVATSTKSGISSGVAKLDSKPAIAKDVGAFIDWVNKK